jgi:hypothetical protein
LKQLSKDNRILFYFFSFLIIFWIIFDGLKYSWSDDPFQKVVLAPLGEEPQKLLVSLLICLGILIGIYIPQFIVKNNEKVKQKIAFITIFKYAFLPFAIFYALIFGFSEGLEYNVLLHFSTTTIAAILIIFIFFKVKDKKWRNLWKALAIFSGIIPSMIFHSISNQYTNLFYANNNPEFGYLVVIARFFESYSFTAGYYVLVLFVMTCFLLYIFVYKFYISKKSRVIKT